MTTADLLETLTEAGVKLWTEEDKLKIRSPKGVVTPALQAQLKDHKAELIRLLQAKPDTPDMQPLEHGLSLYTLGRLIGGFGNSAGHSIASDYTPPVTNPQQMAKQLKVTFRPLPRRPSSQAVLDFRVDLKQQLATAGVTVEPWEQATRDFYYTLQLPGIKRKLKVKRQLVKADIDAVIDVERPLTIRRRSESFVAEKIYQAYCRLFLKGQSISVTRIAQLIGWAEDHAAKYVEDPTNTQIIVLTDLDSEFVDVTLPYRDKINLGLNALIRNFSEVVIGVSSEKLSILNMNLSDSVFPRNEIKTFVNKSLIPKVFVPILPLPISRFELGEYEPQKSDYAEKLVRLGKALTKTGLFPPGFQLSQVIQRQSYRDIVDILVNGRTGVSYGFVAYVEPPQYVGEVEVDASTWDTLLPVEGFSADEMRQNQTGRRYAHLKVGLDSRFRQIPDVWIVSSRSGANKTDLNLNRDVLRIGLTHRLRLELPQGTDMEVADIKPSYDTYVMVAIALAAALYQPDLVKNGAPIVHFHGYPEAEWFQKNEAWVGVQNPSVPCGTYESGAFNFLNIARLAQQPDLQLAALLEPDHGTNIIAPDLDYLIKRIEAGCQQGQIDLGGRHFASLRTPYPADALCSTS